ncbi:hypothetical protein BGW36DRAFT_423529 [Talaromyces proteolyticus]|uniref:VOC domain-containing protein n=1 Tax=Talaromyces proteolyticus TaxID=1131652 RepID=A0AAD4Q0E3_9EURO|nr:uncharacterized protein BGW36DRAFT_423529 [Talaromyces proteolyticus]KAH8703998.1 hypothetical protein BGW36DRAFT_423529 [Talaromyces proteolyticus]
MEIPVTNAPRAIHFYRKVFEWNINDEGYENQVDGIEHTYFFNKGNLRGSFLLVPEDQFLNMDALCAPGANQVSKKMRWGVVSTIAAEDMDETLKKIVDCGRRIFKEKTLLGMEMGSLAKFVDTEGNIHSLCSLELSD